jgi:ankyrin repeat protein
MLKIEIPLYFAITNGDEAIVHLLVEYNAELNIKDNLGWTPLMVAVQYTRYKNSRIVKLLIDKGAELNT